jgi:hypothetical protein
VSDWLHGPYRLPSAGGLTQPYQLVRHADVRPHEPVREVAGDRRRQRQRQEAGPLILYRWKHLGTVCCCLCPVVVAVCLSSCLSRRVCACARVPLCGALATRSCAETRAGKVRYEGGGRGASSCDVGLGPLAYSGSSSNFFRELCFFFQPTNARIWLFLLIDCTFLHFTYCIHPSSLASSSL